ncbi:MAG: DUF2784 domain-containing protein [Syntrophales bacterium]|nr:DUF2784 domain-containing protein [Syntrophales bacterium]
MIYGILADTVVLVHGAFILFVIFGGLAVLYRKWWMWFHLPAVFWGVGIELTGGVCPLTPLENILRQKAGLASYHNDFIEHYLVSLIYPTGLTRSHQVIMGITVAILNLCIYGYLWRRGKGGG